uniref:Centromere protein O n=1 Tax=Tanacetum cinerariifolium TaxID=118510 RepID=A0A6L2K4D4_TANCI|nr:centromere protein O [Tanacetum cinerariifolium]
MIEFIVDDTDCKITVSLRYADLLSILPTAVSVVAWPMNRSKRSATEGGTGKVAFSSNSAPIRLNYAESAMRTLSLPEAYAEIVLNLPDAIDPSSQSKDSSSS